MGGSTQRSHHRRDQRRFARKWLHTLRFRKRKVSSAGSGARWIRGQRLGIGTDRATRNELGACRLSPQISLIVRYLLQPVDTLVQDIVAGVALAAHEGLPKRKRPVIPS